MFHDVTLEGNHVRLEPLGLQHLDGLCDVGLDPELWQWTLAVVRDAPGMRAHVEAALKARDAGAEFPFATIERATGRVVGSTRYLNIAMAHRRLEIGSTWVAAPWQRTAINTEAKYLMLGHAFETLGCLRVELKTDALNKRSQAAIERLGAKHEGVFRRHMITESGRVRDTVWYAITDEDWPQVKANLERMLV
jgi:RimJ/RimL family protein N-acetyltransferase